VQLAPQGIDRLFTSFDETARQSPAAAGSKPVFEKQNLSLIIENYGSCRDREAGMRETHTPTTQPQRQ
jgi:hypothetical protein